MSDIRNCWYCGDLFYMDVGNQCNCCESEYCNCCSYENGINIKDVNGNFIWVCKDCLKNYKVKGLKWFNNELYEGKVSDKIMKKFIEEFKERIKNRK